MKMGTKPTKVGRWIFGVALTLLVNGCATINPTAEATATEAALCTSWGDALPSRSVADTAQTRGEIGLAYDVFEAACPEFAAGVDLLTRARLPETLGPSAGGGV